MRNSTRSSTAADRIDSTGTDGAAGGRREMTMSFGVERIEPVDGSAIAIAAECDLPQWLIASSEDRSDLPRGAAVYTTRGGCRGRQDSRQIPRPATRARRETTVLLY